MPKPPKRLADQNLAQPVVFHEPPAPTPRYIEVITEKRERMNEAMAARLLHKPLYYGGAMVALGEADAMIAAPPIPPRA